MEKIKLYTEEQVRKAIEIAMVYSNYELTQDDVLTKVTPIELPTEEEIENKSKHWGLASDFFYKGAKWVIEQIKQQANGSTE